MIATDLEDKSRANRRAMATPEGHTVCVCPDVCV